MKSSARLLLAILLLTAFVPAQTSTAQQAEPKPAWQQIPIPPLPAFRPQQPKRIQLKNGMVIFLQEDHELPLIDGTMRIRGGGADVPNSKTGMMAVYGEAWRTGGTESKTGDQLDDFLEARAAKVETGGGVDSTSIGFSCLKADFNDVFAVFLDVLQNPEFREDKIELAKDQLNTAVARRNDNIGSIASRESTKLAWGADNPYARQAEYATIAAITRQDLLDLHKRYLYPNNVILGISGDFDSKVMEAALRKAFDGWKRGPAYKKPVIEFKGAKPGMYFIPKEDVNQSAIRMMYPVSITRRSPDYYPIEVMNEVLGGGFASRLVTNVRSKQGLGYAVGGGIGLAFDHPGIFRLSLGTKSQSTVEGVEALKREMLGMIDKPADDAELQRAKDDILNSFIFNFDSKDKVLRERMAYEFYGYPPDFLERYEAGIKKVTTADVARVSKQYLHPDQLATLVVGNDKDFDKPLASLGAVKTIDITIPPPPGEEKAAPAAAGEQHASPPVTNFEESQSLVAPPASNPEGKALMAKVVEALGGAAKVDAVKALHTLAVMTVNAPQGQSRIEYESLSEMPDRIHITAHNTPLGEMTMVVSPEVSFRNIGGRVEELAPRDRNNILNMLHRDLLNVARHREDPQYVFAAGDTEKVQGRDARVLNLATNGVPTRWYIDAESGRVLRAIYERQSDTGPVQSIADYGDWKPVSGLNLPMTRTIQEGGRESHLEITRVEVNPTLDPKLFQKPEAAAKE